MSRQIDISKPLSKADIEYLDSRGRQDLITANKRNLEGMEKVDDGNTGDVDSFTRDDGMDVVAGMHPGETATTTIQAVAAGMEPDVMRQPVHQAGDAGQVSLAAQEGDEDEGDNYDDTKVWPKGDLVKEAEDRNLDSSGNREEIIARLREDDASEE